MSRQIITHMIVKSYTVKMKPVNEGKEKEREREGERKGERERRRKKRKRE